jgi:hypothetical protein
MGNGSPRVLTRFLRRILALAIAGLVFAPAAFADDGVVADISATVANATVNLSPDATAPTLPAPVSVPDTPSVSAPTAPVAAVAQVRIDAPRGQETPPRAIPAPRPSRPRPAVARAPAPRPKVSSRSPQHPLVAQSHEVVGPGSLSPLPSVSSAGASGRKQRAAGVPGPAPGRPKLPFPSPQDLGGGATGAAGAGILLLLFALAAEPLAIALPGLTRRAPQLVAGVLPHPPSLRLERPD